MDTKNDFSLANNAMAKRKYAVDSTVNTFYDNLFS